MSAPAFLKIRHIVKDFDGHRAVDDVSIDIAKGEVFALLGSSGCGKTTLLRMPAGFETPTSGSITLDGRDLAGFPPPGRPAADDQAKRPAPPGGQQHGVARARGVAKMPHLLLLDEPLGALNHNL